MEKCIFLIVTSDIDKIRVVDEISFFTKVISWKNLKLWIRITIHLIKRKLNTSILLSKCLRVNTQITLRVDMLENDNLPIDNWCSRH
jgi:hypothetical protein